MMDGLFAALDQAVMTRTGEGTFRLAAPPPAWLDRFQSSAMGVNDPISPGDHFPFLENFLFDAEAFWAASTEGRIKSGSWIEEDPSGKEWALEATAVAMGQQKILLLTFLGGAHEERVEALQSARENLFIRQFLEEEVQRRTADIRKREEEIALRLVWASESRDEETGAHIRRIGLYAETLARSLGWGRLETEDLRIAATMHDIGKIGIPDSILLKKDRLTFEEFELMKAHPKIGANILDRSDVPLLQLAREIALCHHEKWDGTGYPQGLSGEGIPVSARITAIADIYDALVNERVYKKALAEPEALAIMEAQKGSTFDPNLFDHFIRVLPDFRRISREVV
jgi:response regulator RpfG family c-di-GMP phosphodiesterase